MSMQLQSPAASHHDWRPWRCPRLLIELKLALRQGAGSALLADEGSSRDLCRYLQRQGIRYQLQATTDGYWLLSWPSATPPLQESPLHV